MIEEDIISHNDICLNLFQSNNNKMNNILKSSFDVLFKLKNNVFIELPYNKYQRLENECNKFVNDLNEYKNEILSSNNNAKFQIQITLA